MDISRASLASIEKINLTASLSSVQDADIAKEQMKLTKEAILQNVNISAMAQGNISSEKFINLFA